MSASEETLALLLRIATAVEKLAGIDAQPASDSDLDSQYGDERIKFSPRDWTGDSCKGMSMSQCPPAFLDFYAAAHDQFAKKNDDKKETATNGKPKSEYDRRTARRARGWAARLRAGWTAPAVDRIADEKMSEPSW